MVRISRIDDTEDEAYYFTIGDKQFHSTMAKDDSEVKEWISRIEKQYLNKKSKKNKQTPLVVGLWAERSIGYIDGKTTLYAKDTKILQKTAPYELLVLCVGNQCLLRALNYWEREFCNPRSGYVTEELPKALKDFLSSSQIIVVGFGINAMAKKLEKEFNLLISKQMELRDLVQEKMGQIPGEFATINQGTLVKLVMGLEWEVVKPESMTFEGRGWLDCVSDELVWYGSTEAFVAAEMASKLLPAEPVTQMLARSRKSIDQKLQKVKLKL